jgi:hypothetical protein
MNTPPTPPNPPESQREPGTEGAQEDHVQIERVQESGPNFPPTPNPPEPPEASSMASEPAQQRVREERVQTWKSDDAQNISASSKFEPTLGIDEIKIDDELLVIDPLSERYFRLNPTGVFIWQTVCQGGDLASVAKAIADHFHLENERALPIVLQYTEQLFRAGLLAQR